MEITIDTTDLMPLVSRLNGAPGIIQRHLVQGVDDSGKYVEGTAKGTAPVVTGNYRRNITSRASAIGNGAQAIVQAGAPYSHWVEEGRRGFSARGRALRFTIGGQVIFAKRVGPARGQYIMRNALNANRGRIEARLQRAGREAADEILGGGA